ncbi:hypothetical protein [Brevibacillus migulae]|uniref:hypothetical protein n=1 Tax=Brevibacillus migulae TaxID=1644114 RepID=UPI00106DE1F5|nr:hypothetical protein [Brevibacillus migulae]
MTPNAIIADFFESLPDEQKFPAINRFLADIVNRNSQMLSPEIMEHLLTAIEPIDERSIKALATLEQKLIGIPDRTR